MNNKLIELLRCPVTFQPLRRARTEELDAVNRAIVAGTASTTQGQAIGSAFVAGLISHDGSHLYAIVEDIPVMLAEQAVLTAQVADFPRSPVDQM